MLAFWPWSDLKSLGYKAGADVAGGWRASDGIGHMVLADVSSMSEPVASERVKKLRILIVEDHTPTRMAMSRLIRQAGAEVLTARDGEEGLSYLLTQRFDVL